MTRPYYFNGVPMRSASEVTYARFCQQNGLDWNYEPETFADTYGQWTPDFVLRHVRCTWRIIPVNVYVEVKFGRFLRDIGDRQMRKLLSGMAAVYASRPDAIAIIEQSGMRNRPVVVELIAGVPTLTPAKWLDGGEAPVLGKDLVTAPWHDAWWHQTAA